MKKFINKEIVQAILIADSNAKNFRPFSETESVALLPMVNEPMLDYALEALNRSGVMEVFIFSSLHYENVKGFINESLASASCWAIGMTVHVIGGEGCRCFGDAMRELDSKGLIRENFILLDANCVTNADLKSILGQHKKTVAYDKGAVATLIFKQANIHVRTGSEVMIAMDIQNKRLHHYQELSMDSKEINFEIPLEVFTHNSEIALLNLVNPEIAIGSPSMLSLFSDNFDFETRADFIRGILINEEILDSRIYISLLSRQHYARKVNNWLSYQIVSNDIINRWTYPLVPDMGIKCLTQQYVFLKNNIYRSATANLVKVGLRENVVIGNKSAVGLGSHLDCSVIGRNVLIGQNCRLHYVFIFDNVIVEDNCVLEFCIIGSASKIGSKCELKNVLVDYNCVIPKNTKLMKSQVFSSLPKDGRDEMTRKISEKAYVIDDEAEVADDEDERNHPASPKMGKLTTILVDSDYSCSSDESESRGCSPILDDANGFLSEVIDSLTRGLQEKSNPEYLKLEINSSRYAYNMSLREVNFNVVKAIFNLPPIKESSRNISVALNTVFDQLKPIITHYITTDDAMMDCLKALEDIFEENEFVRSRMSQVVHYLYDKDFITEDIILAWYEQLDNDQHKILKQTLQKFIEWLEQSSDGDNEETD
ncbi:translation initiation factor eIF-2B subunit epsilon [Glossina fuscipes]|uniref:Translation initiation factor eIF2B subunit epsilon n=1 Tax=Glossina fuscipes TaxID=7396 RepID=A0A8U0W5Q0_9MUSC|nr:translation initiation factor eIF-2B subunit epsilon [Glossina fuscipes]KAI9589698.1 hypothetical protein GQX74_007866 [Glossina fuscipes]